MPALGTIRWAGKSGEKYRYWIFPIKDFSFKASPGNYVFARRTKTGSYVPVYVGETGDLSDRFDNHHKMACAIRNGATHIHAHTSSADDEVRRAEESDIIAKWNPVCNG